MRVKDLEIFLDILKTKSPTLTAENFKTTQPNVSIIIKNIENTIGSPLFERLGKRLLPTSKALLLGGLWLEVVEGYYKSLEVIGEEGMFLGEIRIVSTHTIGEYFLPQILYEFAKEYPKVKVISHSHNTGECLNLLKKGEVELALIEGEITKEYAKSEGLIAEVLGKDELVVASNDFILASKPRYIDELLDKKWILREYGSGLRDKFLNALGDMGKEIPIFLELDRTNAIKDLVITKGAISVFSKIAITKEIQEKILFPIEIINVNLERNLYSLKRSAQLSSALLLKFEECLIEAFIAIAKS
ncbi:LysR family transcriptional regulator [Helicobacter apodemus]|uniref:LysR family transcriptional regulator n=1 Tax=Helicobacter apodemus TaxID=135569 RepID=A0A4U8UG22_9HELI|nr:LysR substrate-binding domain-containing protein [Helicobacter apodemus]TLE16638.1 LysR family transcriptional regulator [Helicobacter apodemus]